MAIKAGNIIVGSKPIETETSVTSFKDVVFVEKTAVQENNTVMIDGKPKKFNKISRYMLDMLTTEE